MYFNFKKFIIYIFALTVMLFAVSGLVLAADYNNYGLDDTLNQGNVGEALQKNAVDASQGQGGQYLSTKVGQIIGTLLSFIGVIFMILIIYAGILWMTSSGNEKNVDKAKSLIVSAIIGLIIVLAAYAITAFIGRQLTNSTGGITAPADLEAQCTQEFNLCLDQCGPEPDPDISTTAEINAFSNCMDVCDQKLATCMTTL